MKETSDPAGYPRRLGTAMALLAWLVVLALLTLFFNDLLQEQRNPNRRVQGEVREDGVREVVLHRNRAGHYLANGSLNGHPVVFLVDTGATDVALAQRLAEQLGLPRGRTVMLSTANGVARGYRTVLDEVALGSIRRQSVRATAVPELTVDEVLLGMSFLENLELIQRGKQLTLRQYPRGTAPASAK